MPIRQPVNPNDFIGPDYEGDRDPLAHLKHWLNRGWKYNENSGQFRYIGGGGQPPVGGGGSEPPPTTTHPDTLPGATPGAGLEALFTAEGMLDPAALEQVVGGFGLPLDAGFEAQRRQMVDALNRNMANIFSQRGLVEGRYGLQNARLGTQQGLANTSLLDMLASRGAVGGGIQNRQQRLLDQDFQRQFQDLGFGQAGELGELAQQQSGLQTGFTQQLIEAMLDMIARQAQTGGNAPQVI